MPSEAITFDAPADAALNPLPPSLRAWPFVAALIGLCTLAWAVTQAMGNGGPRIEQLRLDGDFAHVSPQQLRGRIEPLVGGGFFAVDLAAIRDELESEPWIASARVTRAWPGVLRVKVAEHRAAARWGAAGALSEQGAVFTPPAPEELSDSLPRLDGPGGRVVEVLDAYMALVQRLGATPFSPRSVRMDARGEWYMGTADGVELRLGRESPARQAERIATEVLPALVNELERVNYVDLRYSNGFAVGWRLPTEEEDAKNG